MAYSSVILGTPGLLSYWRLGEASGNLLDSKGSNPATTVAGGITRQAPGLLTGDADGAIRGDGVAGTVATVPASASLNTPAVTLECWIKPTALPGTSVTFLDKYTTGGYDLEYNAGAWRWYVRPTTGPPDVQVASSSFPALNPQVGVRHHLVGTYSVADGSRLYVNGTLVQSAAAVNPVGATNAVRFLSDGAANPSFPGTLDEVAIYSAVLTPAQVVDHYNAGLGGFIDASTGTIGLSGSRTESYAPPPRFDAPVGTIGLSGSRTESFVRADARTGTIALSGSRIEAWGKGYVDVCTGTVALSGSRTESWSKTYTDSPSGIVALSGSLADWETIATAAGWGTQVLELPPLRLHVEAVRLDGKRYRWGSDEPDPQNVPAGLRFSSTMPGGYESMDCTLARKPGPVGETADLDRLSTLIVRGAGGAIAGEYRLERTPKTSGDQMSISPSAVGWQAHLDDNKGVSIIYIDREFGSWGGIARQRILNLLGSGFSAVGGGSGNVQPDTTTGIPAMDIGFDDPGGWSATNKPIVEPWYDSGPGNSVGRVRASWGLFGATAAADANWVLAMFLSNLDTVGGGTDSTGDAFTGSQGSTGTFDLVATGRRRFAMMQFYYSVAGGGGATNNHFGMNVYYIRVYGDHLLTIRGSTPQTEGLFASDIIAHAVAKFAPMLVIKPDSIQQSNFIIPQMAFKDNTTATEIVRQSTRFSLSDWGVFEGREFRWYDRNTRGRRWRARIAPAQFEETGLQVDRLWESVIVQYNDVDGSTRTVGPPGSFADVESASLKDIDPDNPANKLGITRRSKLVMGTSTAAAATEVGRRFLEEQKLLDRSGRARITGHVTDDHGVIHPYWRVLAGDLISFIDASDTSYRRIVKADHDATAKTASLDLDAPPEGLDALLERLGVVLAPLGL